MATHSPRARLHVSAPVGRSCLTHKPVAASRYCALCPDIAFGDGPTAPHEGDWATELFGDYTPDTMLIRVWMRTAVRKQAPPSEPF